MRRRSRHYVGSWLVCCAGIGLALATAVADPACNRRVPQAYKYCKDPFTRCVNYNNEEGCDNGSGDEPNWIIPGCDFSGDWNDHCDSSPFPVECNRVFDCIWSEQETFSVCGNGEPSGPPSYTTDYYSDDCNPPGG